VIVKENGVPAVAGVLKVKLLIVPGITRFRQFLHQLFTHERDWSASDNEASSSLCKRSIRVHPLSFDCSETPTQGTPLKIVHEFSLIVVGLTVCARDS
jgi:hypothetical protein